MVKKASQSGRKHVTGNISEKRAPGKRGTGRARGSAATQRGRAKGDNASRAQQATKKPSSAKSPAKARGNYTRPFDSAQASSQAQALRCPVSGECGGCTSIEVPYDQQLASKNARMASLFAEFGLAPDQLMPIIGMQEPYHYRNKVTTPFAPGKRGTGERQQILTGMYAKGSHRIICTDSCLLENERAQQVISAITAIMRKHAIPPYDEDRATGFMRHAIVRVGHESNEMLVTLVTNGETFANSKSFCRELVKRCPFVTTIVQNVNERQTNVILGPREQRLYGPGFILDTLCGLSFRISSQSFYQVNAVQTEVLYEQAIALASLDGTQAVLDAYCGTGTIGLVAAARGAREVIGVDTVDSAIRDARENARHNGIANARFHVGDAGEFARMLAASREHIDVVLMDPPRAGSSVDFLDAVLELNPERLVYISCNPETQVRDIRYLMERGRTLARVQPVDMFPHTDHVETVCLLTRS